MTVTRRDFVAGALGATALTAMPGLRAFAQAADELKLSTFVAPTHIIYARVLQPWAAELASKSANKLTVKMFPAMQLGGTPPQLYRQMAQGISDICFSLPGYTSADFPMMALTELPGTAESADDGTKKLWAHFDKFLARDFKEAKVLMLWNSDTASLMSKNKPIKTLEDMKGLKIRVGGSGVPIAQALGMSVVAMPATEAYEALSRKTADGVLFPWEAMMSFRLNEVATFHLEVPGGMYTSSFMININPKSFDGLNAANRAALLKAGELEGSKFFGRAWDAADKASRDDGIAKKNTIETLSPEQLVIWKKLLQPVRDNWIKMAKEKGLDGEKLLQDFEATVKAQSM